MADRPPGVGGRDARCSHRCSGDGVFTSALFAGDSSGDQENASLGCALVARPAAVDVGSLDAEQLANAQTIVAVGRALGVPSKGWVIALSTALLESTLRNLPYGDRDSIGLFQQRDAWGSRAERLDPATSTEMFFRGGRGGQRGLLAIPDYLSLSVTRAAQAVQVSAFPDAYAKWEGLALQLVGNPSISSAACTPRVGGGEGSKVIEVALTQLGIPYSWGGGTRNGPGLGSVGVHPQSASTARASRGTPGSKPRESRCLG